LSYCCRERCEHLLLHGASLALGAFVVDLVRPRAVEALALGATVGHHRVGLELRRLRRSLVERRLVALRRRKAVRALQRNTYNRLVDGAHLGPQLAAEVLVRKVEALALALARHDQLYITHKAT